MVRQVSRKLRVRSFYLLSVLVSLYRVTTPTTQLKAETVWIEVPDKAGKAR
jgi:hypothetical protein